MSADIFISFASQDGKVARTICAALESRGFSCWISSRDIMPGENFQSAIVRAIRSAKVLLLVFTANSNHSEEMTKELALASQQKLMVVPLRVENVDPSDAFAYEFATRQWIDLFADWEQAMNHLRARLTAALSDDRTHTDTIVLGKPSLREPLGTRLGRVPQARRAVAIGAAVVVLAGVTGITLARFAGKPAPVAAEQSAPAAAAGTAAASMAAPMAAAGVATAETAPAATGTTTVTPEPQGTADTGAATAEEQSKPKPKPKPKTNLPY